MRPIGIDLFAGAGGLSLGFEQAGFDVAAAVEVDPIHCAVHKYNFPNTAVIPKSVVGLTASQIRKAAGIGDREVDCVFGGAPCQGFSMIGQRALDDPRNQLVREFVRIVVELDARTFVFENVKGLSVGKHKSFLMELVEEFKRAGYDINEPVKVLNAAHYETPQSRERLILIGSKTGTPVPYYPEPLTNIAGKKPKYEGLSDSPTCKEALGDLPDAENYRSLQTVDSVRTTRFGNPSKYASTLRCSHEAAWHLGYERAWDPTLLTSSARTEHTEISRRRFGETSPGEVEPISRFFKLPMNGVSNTLRAGTDGARGAFTSPRPIHYSKARCITVREMARIHGFPDWFRFHATKWHGARQVGNAVPPPLARAIATEVRMALGKNVERPNKTLELGSEQLLDLDMTQASNHFGVEPPPNRRDKKSGSKKRKQTEIEKERMQGLITYG